LAPQLTRVGDLMVAVERPSATSSKPPVLLVHGMFGGAWMWEPYQALLARHGYESHALTLRGHHDSRLVPDVGKVSVADYVDDALAIARTLGNPIVIGHSMGGLIAQKVAEQGACRALVLIASAPPRWIPALSGELLRHLVKYLKELFLMQPLFPGRDAADALMFNRTPRAQADEEYDRLVPESGRAGLEISFGTHAVHAPRITAPVLVITGLEDRFVVPRISRAIARKYRAEFRQYENFAHHIINEPGWEAPAADVVEWLDTRAMQ
jgi:non-heme chloroperoxidase